MKARIFMHSEVQKEPFRLLCRIFLHRWNKWGPLDIGSKYPDIEGHIKIEAQLRICTECGKWQVRNRVVK